MTLVELFAQEQALRATLAASMLAEKKTDDAIKAAAAIDAAAKAVLAQDLAAHADATGQLVVALQAPVEMAADPLALPAAPAA